MNFNATASNLWSVDTQTSKQPTPPSPSPETVTLTFNLEDQLAPILDDTNIFILRIVFYICFSIVYGMFGISTNIINIIVFIKQGLFSGGSTLNLFFLALADFGVTVSLTMYGMAYIFIVGRVQGLPVSPSAMVFFAFGWPLAMFTTLNRLLTAYVAFERCMCVVIPFKVKNIFSPRKNLVYLLIIVFYGVFSHTPIYIVHYLGEVVEPGTNRTQLDLTFGPDREFWHDLVYYGNYLVLSVTTAGIVMICTVITSAYVRTSKEWRKKSSSVSSDSKSSTNLGNSKTEKGHKKISKPAVDKEARLVKMIMTISLIFCICYIPEVVLLVIRSVDPRINTRGQYERMSHFLYTVKFHFAAVNSGINIFVYYRMSGRYRQIFLSYFTGHKDVV